MTHNRDNSRIKIMIVDDDNFFCQQLTSELGSEGYHVEYERNVQKGLKKIAKWHPHIIVSDYSMHTMDYFEFAEEIEKLKLNATLVVVSSSHLDGTLLAQLTNLSGVKLAVQKPIDIEVLTGKIVQLIPDINEFDLHIPEEETKEEEAQEFGINDLEIQRELARLKFEGKELPRILNSLKALSQKAQNQPQNGEFFKEALVQSEKTLVAVRNQGLSHLEAPFVRVNDLLLEIREQGFHPRLNEWDQLYELLDKILDTKSKKVDSASLTVKQREEKPVEKQQSQSLLGSDIRLSFLVIGEGLREELLNLASIANVNMDFIDSSETLEESKAASYDLVIFHVAETMTENRAISEITDIHDTLGKFDHFKNKPFVVISEIESMRARVVTAHLNESYWFRWSVLKGNVDQFKALRIIASKVNLPPTVLILNSVIANSEELMRELSRHCKKVDVADSMEGVFEKINSFEPDVLVVSEKVGELNGVDICRAIKDSIEYRKIVVVLDVENLSDSTINGAALTGADGIVCRDAGELNDSTNKKICRQILAIYNRRIDSRRFDSDASLTQNLDLPTAIKDSIDHELNSAINNQTPFSVCLVKITNHSILEFKELWSQAIYELAPDSSCFIHTLSDTQLVVTVSNMRRKGIEKVVDRIHNAIIEKGLDEKQPQLQYVIRCYPDDALTLSELIKSEI